MRSFLVIVLAKLQAEQAHVFLAEHDEMIEALLLDCLHEPIRQRRQCLGIGLLYVGSRSSYF